MKKAAIFILYLLFAGCVGFIVGMRFGNFYNKDLIFKTITQSTQAEELMDWYELIIFHDTVLNNLDKIHNMNELETIKDKYRKSGLEKIRHYLDQVNSMKKGAEKPSVIIELKNNVKKYEKHFKQLSD
jgi:hypothetical protein